MAKKLSALQQRLHSIIYEANTPMGKGFDIALMIFILASVIVVIIESVDSISSRYIYLFYTLEWIFTIFFTIEYILRIYCIGKPWKYILSFYGIIDFLAILPSYLGIILVGQNTQYLLVIRALRLLRVFRIFKLGGFMKQSNIIVAALKASREKIFVFLFFILLSVTIIGSVLYFVEGESNPQFSNIPTSIYWAIVTLTTVGYGDISPETPLGQFLAAVVMIMGYVVIAVPTGIVSAELVSTAEEEEANTKTCKSCGKEGHADDAKFCKYCGEEL